MRRAIDVGSSKQELAVLAVRTTPAALQTMNPGTVALQSRRSDRDAT